MSSVIPPPPPGAPIVRRRPRVGRLFGFVVMGGGVAAGLALLYVGGARIDDAVSKLAQAPIGCVTVLDVDEPGRYTVSVATSGDLAPVTGGCPVIPGPFDGDPDAVSADDVEIRITDAEGAVVPLDASAPVRYDAPSGRGVAVGTVDLVSGEVTVAVDWRGGTPAPADEADDVVAIVTIGAAPNDAGSTFAVFGLAVIVIGLLGGALLVLFGRRRPRVVTVVRPPVSGGWAPPTA